MTSISRIPVLKTLCAAAFALGAGSAGAADVALQLSGTQEVPPVETAAAGQGKLSVAADGTLSGQVTTTGIDDTAAHIHAAPAGQNGPVVVPLAKNGDGVWAVPAGTKLTDEQLKRLQAGELYVNVHSAAHKSGEIRAQLKP